MLFYNLWCKIVYSYVLNINNILNFLLAYTQRTPTISHITQKPIKDIGGTAELTCSVLYAMDFPVLWVKIDRGKVTDPVVLSTGSTLIIKDSRFSLRQDIDSSSYTLQVHNIFKVFII